MAKRKTARSGARTRGRATPAGRTTGRSGKPRAGKKAAATRTGARKAGAGKRRPARAAGTKAASGRKRTPAGRKTAGSSRKPAAPTRRTSSAKGSARARTGAKATSRTLPTRKTKKAAGTRTAAGRRTTSSTRARRPLGKRDRPVHDAIERDRTPLEETVQSPPSSLDLDRSASAARSGRAELEEALLEHTATGPAMTGGDVDADWESAYSTGDEAPGGDMPTPDQSVVEEIATSVGVEYADNEELKGVDKIEERDRHRWEYDPASSEDYRERTKRK